MRRLAALAATLLAVLAAGCGSRTPSDTEQVRDVLATFSRAIEQRDYQTLCDDVFAPDLLTGLQEIGLPCEVALRNSLGEVEEPRLTIGDVEVRGDRATAQVRSSAAGQKPSEDTIALVRVDGQWKVADLGGGGTQDAEAGDSEAHGREQGEPDATRTPTATPTATPTP